ncbi:MAG: M3 family metallopeptidase [Gammaproteobacteria bacterium]|nr:M3 family metallopeptidase [Gammaproteobacteria bacterium]
MTGSNPNPLLDLSGLPRFQDIRPEHVETAVDTVLAESRVEIERLVSLEESPSWANFAQPMEDTDERIARVWSPVSHLNSVMDSPELRTAYEACLPKLTAYHTEVGQNLFLYRAYQGLHDSAEFATLDCAQQKIVTNALRDFRLSGVDLEESAKQRFKEIQQRLSQLANRFEQHVLDATQGWSFETRDPDDLAGLPESVTALAAQAAHQAGLEGWKFSLDMPLYLPFMRYAKGRELRQRMYAAFVTRASDQGPHDAALDNAPLIAEILKLRYESARCLGFDHYALVSLETKMARDANEVTGFLRELAARSKPAALRELAQVTEFAARRGCPVLEPWDLPFYSEQLKQSLYQFSEEDIRPYFPVPRVLAGMFTVVGRLFGLEIRPIEGIEVWHEDVRMFEISDTGGQVIGRFYVDLYVRANKRGGAWMDDCIGRKRTRDGVQVPVAYLTCNFSPPVNDRPALLTHEEVITLFHEFGHGLHHMLTRVDHLGVSGINGVAWDAVELPSQFLENWCWEREALDCIAGHYETGAPLPQELLTKMRAAKNFQSGMHMVRQIEFALFDMRLHAEPQEVFADAAPRLLREVRDEVAVVIPPEYDRFQNSFSHIFAGGYAAGYYSYKWAEVLSADAFAKFEEQGIFDPETGRAFRQTILEQGGSRDPMELFVAFRGREPTVDALLRHTGLEA